MSEESTGDGEPSGSVRSGPTEGSGRNGSADQRESLPGEEDRGRGDHGSSATEDTVKADAASTEAYLDGRRLLRPVAVHAGRDAHIMVRTHVVTGMGGVTSAPGPVPPGQIEALRASYTEVTGHETLLQQLRSRRLLVLVGSESSGRSTTGLHLLDSLAGGAVSRLDPTTAVTAIGEQHIETGHGYLGELDHVDVHSRVAADRLAALLDRVGSWCVLVTRPSPGVRRVLGHYQGQCRPVEPIRMLRQHLRAGVRPDDPPLLDAQVDELAERDDVRRLLGSTAPPAHVAEIAALLLMHARGEIDMPQVEARTEALTFDDRFEEWFSILGGAPHGVRAQRARRLSAMRIAVAVFDGMPRHIAETAADDLAAHLGAPPMPAGPWTGTAPPPAIRTGTRLLDPDNAQDLAGSSSIEFERRNVPLGKGTVPGTVVRYADERMPEALLRWTWLNQYALREPVIEWLDGLSRDPRKNVRLRAAQAAGLLCSIDYTHMVQELVQPAAEAKPDTKPPAIPRPDDPDDAEEVGQDRSCVLRREFAALAMDHAARDVNLRKSVRGRLSAWRRSKDPALRWTAAIALGYDVGARDVDKALEELRVLGTPWVAGRYRELEESKPGRRRSAALLEEKAVFHAAGEGVAELFQYGAHRRVLEQLDRWMDDRRWSVRLLAVQAVIYIMGMSVSHIGRPEIDDPNRSDDLVTEDDRRDRAGWPVLLAVQRRSSDLAGPSADLVRRALRSKDRAVAFKVLAGWLEQAAEDAATFAAVEAVLPLLVVDESDRGRLRGLVRQMQHRWEDRLSDEVAERLDDAIVGISVMTGKKVFV